MENSAATEIRIIREGLVSGMDNLNSLSNEYLISCKSCLAIST
jgi:hypothetical protein